MAEYLMPKMGEYPMPESAPDPFKGFREELGNIEKKRAEKQEKALRMASMIEMADSSTMFGGDYSIANQWAEHLTKNLDDYASSTEGMIKFQQKAQQLTNFIDGAEAYKKENFGSVKDGPQAGSFQGFAMRKALGENVYGDFEDERDPQSYEMTYMGLNQPIELNWDADDNPVFMSDGKPVSFSQYRRPDSPFMPKLKEGKILMGSTWYASEGPNKSHASSAEAYDYSKAMAKTDPKLARQAARFYQMEEKPNMNVDAIMANPVLMEEAREMWAKDAEKSWVDLNKPKEEKPTAKQINQQQDLQALIDSITRTQDVFEVPSMSAGTVDVLQKDQITFSPIAISKSLDITDFLPADLKTTSIKNPRAEEQGQPENILVSREVSRTPSNISVLRDGTIVLSGLGNVDDQAIGDISIDPKTSDGRRAIASLGGLFREAYGVSFEDFVRSLNINFEEPETVEDRDPLGLGL